MTNPQPRHLKEQAPSEQVQPYGRSPQDAERVAQEAAADRLPTPSHGTTTSAPGKVQSATSPEAAIPRDPMNGQALNDRSLVSGKDSEQSDGTSDSMHRPES